MSETEKIILNGEHFDYVMAGKKTVREDSFDFFYSKLTAKQKEVNKLEAESLTLQSENDSLLVNISTKRKEIEERDAEITSLTERLKTTEILLRTVIKSKKLTDLPPPPDNKS